MTRIVLFLMAVLLSSCLAFVPQRAQPTHLTRTYPLYANGVEEALTETKPTLEEKMKSWEASEEEIKAASLGGVVPKSSDGKGGTDAFDVGLYILFPIMVVGLGLFGLFPILVQNIDVTSVGPPPTS